MLEVLLLLHDDAGCVPLRRCDDENAEDGEDASDNYHCCAGEEKSDESTQARFFSSFPSAQSRKEPVSVVGLEEDVVQTWSSKVEVVREEDSTSERAHTLVVEPVLVP